MMNTHAKFHENRTFLVDIERTNDRASKPRKAPDQWSQYLLSEAHVSLMTKAFHRPARNIHDTMQCKIERNCYVKTQQSFAESYVVHSCRIKKKQRHNGMTHTTSRLFRLATCCRLLLEYRVSPYLIVCGIGLRCETPLAGLRCVACRWKLVYVET